ncbi:MAG TPA: hypothetical protein VGG77_15085 [Roseiarcus sp.]
MPLRPGASPLSIRSADGAIGLVDFYSLPSTSRFMFLPTHELWPGDAINRILSAVPTPRKVNGKFVTIPPATWLMQNRRVEQTSWAPGAPQVIEGRLISEGGWRDHPGARCLNLYRPPGVIVGDARLAGPWIAHLHLVYPDDDQHIGDWLAHRVQHPEVKPNHAIVLGGAPGIGKDTILGPVRIAVGPWNFKDISPSNLMEPFNPHVRAVILRMNEAHDLGESDRVNRFSLYERSKIYAASPPEVLRCNEKFLPSYYLPNVLGLVITTNHGIDGIYLPADDRRHYVAWSPLKKEAFADGYFERLWHWIEHEGGAGHVAAYLMQRDLSKFDPHAPPRLTPAFNSIVNAAQSPEDAELADVLDELKRPVVCSVRMMAASNAGMVLEWLLDRKSRRAMPHRMARCGYVVCPNPNADDGLWRIDGRRQTLYAKEELSPDERLNAAKDHVLKATKATGNS